MPAEYPQSLPNLVASSFVFESVKQYCRITGLDAAQVTNRDFHALDKRGNSGFAVRFDNMGSDSLNLAMEAGTFPAFRETATAVEAVKGVRTVVSLNDKLGNGVRVVTVLDEQGRIAGAQFFEVAAPETAYEPSVSRCRYFNADGQLVATSTFNDFEEGEITEVDPDGPPEKNLQVDIPLIVQRLLNQQPGQQLPMTLESLLEPMRLPELLNDSKDISAALALFFQITGVNPGNFQAREHSAWARDGGFGMLFCPRPVAAELRSAEQSQVRQFTEVTTIPQRTNTLGLVMEKGGFNVCRIPGAEPEYIRGVRTALHLTDARGAGIIFSVVIDRTGQVAGGFIIEESPIADQMKPYTGNFSYFNASGQIVARGPAYDNLETGPAAATGNRQINITAMIQRIIAQDLDQTIPLTLDELIVPIDLYREMSAADV